MGCENERIIGTDETKEKYSQIQAGYDSTGYIGADYRSRALCRKWYGLSKYHHYSGNK